nr:heparan-alpha-glucosaminide N-acetyltransferase domain-containing protein [Candidatus Sigynarchaeota archaeon]
MKRFVSIDFLRGFAILGMIALHVFIVTFNTDIFVDAVQGHGDAWLIVVAAVIMYFSSFAGLFVAVSAFGNVASMQKQFERLQGKPDAYKIVRKNQVMRGLVVILFSLLITLILWPYIFNPIAEGIAGELTWQQYVDSWANGTIAAEWVVDLYFVDVITFLGLATTIIALIYTELLRRGKNVAEIRHTLGIITVILFVATPFVLTAIRAVPFMNWPDPHHWAGRTFFENLGAWLLSLVGGVNQAIFPWFGMTLIGTMMGLDLLDKPVTKDFTKKWYKIGWLMFAIGFAVQIGVLIVASALDDPAKTIFENGFGTFFGFSGPSSGYMLFSGGGEVLIMTLFLELVEGKNKAMQFARRTVVFRRSGLIAMSLYALHALSYVPVLLLEYAFGLHPDQREEQLWQSLLIITICVAIWILVSWAWEKVKFKGSLEWVAAKLLGKMSRREHAADKLDPKEALYDIQPLGQPELK